MFERYKVFEELLRFALDGIKINRVYLDRGFYEFHDNIFYMRIHVVFYVKAIMSQFLPFRKGTPCDEKLK